MYDLYSISPDRLSMSVKALQSLLKKRDSFPRAKILLSTHQFIFLTRKDGKKLRLASMMPETTSGIANKLATDKLATATLLDEIDIKQPETKIASPGNIKSLLQKHSKIVIKPVDGAHGNGITTDLTTVEDAEKAAKLAESFSDTKVILAQQQLESSSYEVRAIVIDGKFIAAFSRIPARVTGDGTHTVRELIAIENDTLRTKPYASDLAFIDKEYSDHYLELTSQADYIPTPGEKVQVIRMCNIGRGGTVEDITDAFPDHLKASAEAIAKHLALPVAGIDFLDDYVIEVNSNPSLYYPAKTRSSLAVSALLDYLEKL